ncbi:hypothetical protein STK_08010 [Sulfurisphaera tokodaii str. 7]|uniref:Uncharacterized protein n=1 Tax=Sulfurisphaera tokodaii (strain DSM 16993 / JCM 10545 / NBRC 100140 / 7) TaxID=273063 RepID=Q973U7_SULTO|nr:hypothetical protein STK_08010 [Sulfurisphaera tokodaii str. 7]
MLSSLTFIKFKIKRRSNKNSNIPQSVFKLKFELLQKLKNFNFICNFYHLIHILNHGIREVYDKEVFVLLNGNIFSPGNDVVRFLGTLFALDSVKSINAGIIWYGVQYYY